MIGLWQRVCDCTLPARCTKQWYYSAFCGISAENYERQKGELDDETVSTIARRLEGTVKPYDVVALMTLLPKAREIFDFEKSRHVIKHKRYPCSGEYREIEHFFFLHKEHAPSASSVEQQLSSTFKQHTAQVQARAHTQAQLMHP